METNCYKLCPKSLDRLFHIGRDKKRMREEKWEDIKYPFDGVKMYNIYCTIIHSIHKNTVFTTIYGMSRYTKYVLFYLEKKMKKYK